MKPCLAGLDFKGKQIYEVVISTLGSNGKPNAAPMGIVVRPPRSLIIRPFKTSLTYHNLKADRCGVANITVDPEVFFKTTFKGTHGGKDIPATWFTRMKSVRAPALRHADVKIAFAVTFVKDDKPKRASFICTVKEINARRSFPRPYCRSDFATIECVIHATRVRELLIRRQTRKAKNLIQLIKHYGMLAKRVSPNSRNTRIIGKLLSYIKMWRHEIASSR